MCCLSLPQSDEHSTGRDEDAEDSKESTEPPTPDEFVEALSKILVLKLGERKLHSSL